MKIRIISSVLTVGLLMAGLSSAAIAQTRRGVAATTRQSLLTRLPASDAVAQVNVKRVLTEAMPKLLAGGSAKKAEVDSQIEQFKTRTSLDAHAFDELAVGMRYSYPSAGITKIATVAVARGAFNTNAIAAAGKLAADGKYREEKYLGKTIYIFTLDQQVRLFGLWDLKITELAITPLDANTLALGEAERVRNTVAAIKQKGSTNSALIALATQDPTAIAGFAGNVSTELLQNLHLGNQAIAKDVSSVRLAYGSLAMTEKDLEMLVAARTLDAISARSLGDTMETLKQLGPLFINRLSGIKGTVARSALGNLKITTQGNELKMRTTVAQSEVAPLVGGL